MLTRHQKVMAQSIVQETRGPSRTASAPSIKEKPPMEITVEEENMAVDSEEYDTADSEDDGDGTGPGAEESQSDSDSEDVEVFEDDGEIDERDFQNEVSEIPLSLKHHDHHNDTI